MTKSKGKKGSYALKGKKPFQYSQAYRDWRRATCIGEGCKQNSDAAQEAREAHAAQFGYALRKSKI